MTWARLDDSFHSHPKTVRAWSKDPAAIGLFTRILSWAADHNRDGHVPVETIEMFMPSQPDRERAIDALKEAGLLDENGTGYVLHDYLDYNPSAADLEERRKADAERKRAGRSGGDRRG